MDLTVNKENPKEFKMTLGTDECDYEESNYAFELSMYETNWANSVADLTEEEIKDVSKLKKKILYQLDKSGNETQSCEGQIIRIYVS